MATTNWDRLHELTEAAASIDSDQMAGWGGTGPSCHRPETLFGLARLYAQASRRIEACWQRCHDLRGPRAEAPEDYRLWGVQRPDGALGVYGTHRGARWSATRCGGTVVQLLDPQARDARIERETDTLRHAVRAALAVGRLYAAVVEALGGQTDAVMCVPRDGQVGLQGPAWWAGQREDHGRHPVAALEAFAAGGSLDELRAALTTEEGR